MANTRLKDFDEIWQFAGSLDFDRPNLRKAIDATFECRGTKLQAAALVALFDEFSSDPQKQLQWKGFLSRTGIEATDDLVAIVATIQDFLLPLVADPNGDGTWSPGSGRWQS